MQTLPFDKVRFGFYFEWRKPFSQILIPRASGNDNDITVTK